MQSLIQSPRKIAVGFILCISMTGLLLTPASANQFPGTGSKDASQKACEMSNQGNILLKSGQVATGFDLLHKAVETYPGDAELVYNVGVAHQAYAHMGLAEAAKRVELEKAETYFKEAAKIKPSQMEVLSHLASVQAELNKNTESIANLQAVLAMPNLDNATRQKAQSALQYVQGKIGTASMTSSPTSSPTSSTTSSTISPAAATPAPVGISAASTLVWQTYNSPGALFTMQYPVGWTVSTDPKTGKINAKNNSGASLQILPFFTNEKLGTPTEFFTAFLTSMAPGEQWSKPEILGTSVRSTYANAREKAVAAIELYPLKGGSAGKICVAKTPVGAAAVPFEVYVQMVSSLKFNAAAIAASTAVVAPQPAGQTQAQGQAASMSIGGYRSFSDPDENSFALEVPVGWTVKGGMTRASSIDARPWVVAVAPDQSITAFIGDGSIGPYTMPSATLNWTGYTPGRAYNGGIVRSYVPARKYVEEYARNKLKKVLTNIQVVQEVDHPEVARAYNGTGGNRNEACSIKITGMYGNIPAVGYYICATKANIIAGSGMWWVGLIAGELSPADRDEVGLEVIRHMLATYGLKPEWKSNSVANAGAVSRNFRAASEVKNQAIMNNYWSQQAANDSSNASYWNRQAVQDHAANNFSNYIRGQETVRDTQTGTNYQVQYGPNYHWIDGAGNQTATDYNSPGAGWRQLMSVP